MYRAEYCQHSQREAAARYGKDIPAENTNMTFLIRNIFQSPRLIIPEQGSAPARPYIFPSLKWFTVSSHFPGLLCSVFRPDLAGDIDQLFQCRIFANKAAPQNIGRAAGAAGGVGRQALYWTWTPTCSHRAGGGSGLQPRTLQTCSRVAIIITTNNCVFFYSTICTLATTTTSQGAVVVVAKVQMVE